MTEQEDIRATVARLIRQSREMGEKEWFLDGMDRRTALDLLRPTVSVGTAPSATPAVDLNRLKETLARPTATAGAGGTAAPEPESRATREKPAQREVPGGVDLPVLPDDYDALREVALSCTRCGLSETRTQVVFSDGAADARLMVVGEAPGANEDETGRPFVGAAGKYLDLLLATVDLSREESVYICNVLKCRPPGNRNPRPDEIQTCSPYLRKQIELVRPRAILAVGSFSAQLLTGREKTALGRLRGEVHSYEGVPLVVTYHPAALLRNANWTRAFWDDLQLLRDVIDQEG